MVWCSLIVRDVVMGGGVVGERCCERCYFEGYYVVGLYREMDVIRSRILKDSMMGWCCEGWCCEGW